MAKQYQLSATASDFQKVTFSFWFRIPTSAAATAAAPSSNSLTTTPGQYRGGIELLTFGTHSESSFFHDSYGSINLSLGDTGNGWGSTSETFGTTGAPYVITAGNVDNTAWTVAAWLSGGNVHGGDGVIGQYAMNYDSTTDGVLVNGLATNRETYAYGHTAYLNNTFTYDQWHHVMIAADISLADQFGTFSIENTLGNHTYYQGNVGITRNRIIEVYFDKVRKTGVYTSTADLTTNFIDHTFTDDGWSFPPDSAVRNALLNGKEISIPTFTGIGYNPEIKYAEFQCWIGQYINPAVNMNKFVDSNGKPVNATTAELAFGKPTFRFRRDKKKKLQFTTNDGTGGTFSNTGGITDFSTGPVL